MSGWIAGLTVSRYLILAIIIAIYFMLGCFLDAVSMMVLTLPVIFPVIVALNFNPIWFGVVAVLMMGKLITPPVEELLTCIPLPALPKILPMAEIFKGATHTVSYFDPYCGYYPYNLSQNCAVSSESDGRII